MITPSCASTSAFTMYSPRPVPGIRRSTAPEVRKNRSNSAACSASGMPMPESATSSTALGPHGVNIMDFCKNFNAKTAKDDGLIIPVVVTIYADRSYSFITKTPPNTYFLKKAAGIESGAKTVGTQIVGKVTKKQIEEIAKQKMPDLNCDSIESAMAQIIGSARSMGLQVVE